jgi:hypothetical protein
MGLIRFGGKDVNMLREFEEQGMAVYLDEKGNVIRQLVSFYTKRGKTYFKNPSMALTYCYKKEAMSACKSMGWPLDRVTRGRNMVSSFWFIRHDFRDNYALACWEI